MTSAFAVWAKQFKRYKRRKTESGYDVIAPDGSIIGNVVRTGEYSRDDYPWSWSLADGVKPYRGRVTGVTETLGDGVETVALAHHAGLDAEDVTTEGLNQ